MTLLGMWLLALMLLGFPDVYFLKTAATASIPLVGPTSFKLVLAVLPLLMLAVRMHLDVYIRHERAVEKQLMAAGGAPVWIASHKDYPLMRAVRLFVLYLSVPTAFAAMTYKGMVFLDWGAALFAGSFLLVSVHLLKMSKFANSCSFISKLAISTVIAITVASAVRWTGEFRRPFQLGLAELNRVDLERQDLRGANLYRANLNGASLVNSNLAGAIFIETDLSKADLSGATLTNAAFIETNLEGANLSWADFTGSFIQNTKFQQANLRGANLSGVSLATNNLEGADFSNANLSGALLVHSNLQNAMLRGTNLQNANLSGANLSGAFLIEDFYIDQASNEFIYIAANLEGTDLSKVNLSGAVLSGINIQKANLSGANLAGASLQKADLSEAKVIQGQLDHACGLDVILPNGLSIIPC